MLRDPPDIVQPPLLRIADLSVAYGRATVVHSVSLEIQAGQFVALLGRNGAGKSTILNAISGLIPKKSGSVYFAGHDISAASARAIAVAGVSLVLERHRVFTQLSIEDNLLIGTYILRRGGDRSKLPIIYDLFPELALRRNELAGKLSGGQQEILAVAQAMISNPRLFILDEPSCGLAPLVVDRILEVAAEFCRRGAAVLLVEQLVDKALKYADQCYLLKTGSMIANGTVDAIRAGDQLRNCYLGS